MIKEKEIEELKPDIFWDMRGYCLECHRVHKKESVVLRCKEVFLRKGRAWAQAYMTPEGKKGVNKPR